MSLSSKWTLGGILREPHGALGLFLCEFLSLWTAATTFSGIVKEEFGRRFDTMGFSAGDGI